MNAHHEVTSTTLRHGSHWRQNGLGILRIAFGIVWTIDASFKWQPAFVNHVTSYLSGAIQGQPHAIQSWIQFWLNIVRIDPHLFARMTALTESLLALTLILGVFTNVACIGGAILSFMIWSTAEGFGGPYVAGSTDIGTSIIYVLVFAALFLSSAGTYFGLDPYLGPKLGSWSFVSAKRQRV